MSKQRLLKLAGLTEARYAGSSFQDAWVVVATSDDGEMVPIVSGPFFSLKDARAFRDHLSQLPWDQQDYEIMFVVEKLTDPKKLEQLMHEFAGID